MSTEPVFVTAFDDEKNLKAFVKRYRIPGYAICGAFIVGSSRILVGAEGGFHAQFSAVEEDSNAEVLELAEAFGS